MSALNQTYVEVIVIDDGSRDGAMDVISRYAGRLAGIIEKPNGGQASAYPRVRSDRLGDERFL